MTQWEYFIQENQKTPREITGSKWEMFVKAAPIECWETIGVCLDDNRNPPKFYEFDGFYDTKTVDLVLLDSQNKNRMYTRRVPIELFWPLT